MGSLAESVQTVRPFEPFFQSFGIVNTMTRAEEQKLIERAIAGDRLAAAEFIKAHQASLYAYMLRMSGRPEVAEDIVQDAFVRALTNLHRFDFKFRFSTWLFTIAKRLYVNAMQKHKPAYDTDVVGAAQGAGAAPEARTVDGEVSVNAKAALDFALAQLSEDQREIVVLFHQLDWPIAQIAEHMDMPEGTIKSHLHRGRQRMRAALESHAQFSRHVSEVWA
jgi:RNA polymerase sigma-70 factor (ECF subfamily)